MNDLKDMRPRQLLPLLGARTYSTADLGRRRAFYAPLALGDLRLSEHAVKELSVRGDPVSEEPNGEYLLYRRSGHRPTPVARSHLGYLTGRQRERLVSVGTHTFTCTRTQANAFH